MSHSWIRVVAGRHHLSLRACLTTGLALTLAACARPAAPVTEAVPTPLPTSAPGGPTATVTPESSAVAWETLVSDAYAFSIDYPVSLAAESAGPAQSWTISERSADAQGVAPSFIYISVIPAGTLSEGGEIYNYSTRDVEALWALDVGESVSLAPPASDTPGFTYQRGPDMSIAGRPARVYVNGAPWEFPTGTTETRYYLVTERFTYLIGGYVQAGAEESDVGAITPEWFDRIVRTFRLLSD